MIEEARAAHGHLLHQVEIRRMRGSDIETVSQIERQSFPTPWTTQAYVNEMSNPAASYHVATLGDRVVGYGGTWVVMDEAHITTLGVDPGLRGMKIGERLLAELLVVAELKGASRATLEVREGNKVAQRLYGKYGFDSVSVRKGYYSDNQENAIIMWINDMRDPEWRSRFNDHRAALGLPAV